MKKVVIAGGGTAGWIAAATLSKSFKDSIELVLVESDAIPTVGVGEATIPPIINLHGMLGISEKEFLSRTNGTFKLGISFENWLDNGKKYIHSFGFAGQSTWVAGFQHYWLAGVKRGINLTEYGDYCPEHLACRMDKFAVLAKGGVNYAYHLDAGLYAKFLREVSEKHGTIRKEGTIEGVNIDSENGNIKSIALASGEVIEGDLFIDCTGFRALLIEEALKTGYEDWSHWLPCNSAIAAQTETVSEAIPYTRSIARESGWQWRIPLQSRVGNGLVYCSDYMSDDDAIKTLTDNVEGKLLTVPKVIKFKTGTRKKIWNKNCIAVGLSSGFLEPLESTSIHLIQKTIARLVQIFPSQEISQHEIDEFNSQAQNELLNIRDFIILHYYVTQRSDSPFWNYCKNMPIPASLEHRINLFKKTGKVYKRDYDLFGEESWIQVMLGQGIMPESYHPVVDAMSDEELRDLLQGWRSATRQKVDKLPKHQEFIDYYCKSVMM